MSKDKKNTVVIYTTPTCPYCHSAKDFFKEKGIEYSEYNVAEDQDKAKEMVDKSGQMGVPVILIDDEVLVGFNKPAVEKALGL